MKVIKISTLEGFLRSFISLKNGKTEKFSMILSMNLSFFMIFKSFIGWKKFSRGL
jgi:hypothetical protein